MHSLIIHMSSSTARRPNAERLRDLLPGAELIEAVDGRDAARVPDVEPLTGTLHRPHYPFPLRPAEIGVFESHRRCWRRIVESGWDYALITEDDLRVDSARLDRALALIRDHANPEMYIRLPVKQREKPVETLARDGDMQFVLPRVIGLQCICQVVGRGAATRLLAATDRIDRPVDTLLQMHWVTDQPVHTILGAGNAEIAGQIGGSTIQTKTRASGKLAREFKRALYRMQVALRPQAF
ncbi:glycosyltransferase family 25 protein [Sedimentitalea todarodis]|uniref:Glycosyltransferase family 25 protein n=1 Tax=Sedimentitalea todarodis TaxID=1631240 RepID=A0ABU3V9Z6_9RHOB|nr:glycosyltransferase family 25 protein [Sedimentitalea todarodis]MDU9002997.1 glycosyltransferase family 25 protein [Sedimentitalea todarodis]